MVIVKQRSAFEHAQNEQNQSILRMRNISSGLLCPHMPEDTFSHSAAKIKQCSIQQDDLWIEKKD